MPKSRGRRPKQPRQQSRARSAGGQAGLDWGMAALVQAADAAEARGDAAAALEIMEANPVGADGRFFWRPWRVSALLQLEMFHELLPRWATSRWILAQAQHLLLGGERAAARSMEIAVELRGGPGALPGTDEVDAGAKVIDHDWAFRQLFLYEYGGLEHFLRRAASPDLVAGADRIHDWARAPMRALRLMGRTAGVLHWHDVGTDDDLALPDLGAATLVMEGECVIGRVVPAGEGRIFEGPPLWVPDDVAGDVAADPPAWVEALRRGVSGDRPADERVQTCVIDGSYLLTDVPDGLWAAIARGLCDRPDPSVPASDDAAGLVLAALRRPEALEELVIDPWACVGAALLHPGTIARLDEELGPADVPRLHALGRRLAGVSPEVCRLLAASRTQAA